MFKVKDAYIIHTKRIIETVSEYRTSMYVLLGVMGFLYAVTAFTCKTIPYYEALALICCGTAIVFGVLGAFEILGVERDINEGFSLDSLDVVALVGQQEEDISEFPIAILKKDLLGRIWWLKIWAILKIAVFCAFSFLFSWLLWCYLGYDYFHCKN